MCQLTPGIPNYRSTPVESIFFAPHSFRKIFFCSLFLCSFLVDFIPFVHLCPPSCLSLSVSLSFYLCLSFCLSVFLSFFHLYSLLFCLLFFLPSVYFSLVFYFYLIFLSLVFLIFFISLSRKRGPPLGAGRRAIAC